MDLMLCTFVCMFCYLLLCSVYKFLNSNGILSPSKDSTIITVSRKTTPLTKRQSAFLKSSVVIHGHTITLFIPVSDTLSSRLLHTHNTNAFALNTLDFSRCLLCYFRRPADVATKQLFFYQRW